MPWQTRNPTEADRAELRNLIDAQEFGLDPNHKTAGESWPLELLRGHYDRCINQVWCDSEGVIRAWASIQPDDHRQRVEIELFRQLDFPDMDAVWQWCLSITDESFPGWVVWPTVNHRDHEMADIFRSTGFALKRRYYILTRPLHGEPYPVLPDGVSIDVIRTDEDFHEWHGAHQDAFSHHFGFTPRPAEQWIPHFRKAEAADPNGRFLLRVNGITAGFVSCNNDNAHENGGFVELLGVRYDFQRRGFGELLLNWAFAYSAGRGFTDIGLTVDTGNESGALALYERLGFRPLSEFQLFARD